MLFELLELEVGTFRFQIGCTVVAAGSGILVTSSRIRAQEPTEKKTKQELCKDLVDTVMQETMSVVPKYRKVCTIKVLPGTIPLQKRVTLLLTKMTTML